MSGLRFPLVLVVAPSYVFDRDQCTSEECSDRLMIVGRTLACTVHGPSVARIMERRPDGPERRR
jgi:hypothetical protein